MSKKKNGTKIEIKEIENWSKQYNLLKTLKHFCPALENNRYKVALSKEEITELMKEITPKDELKNIKNNKDIQSKVKLHFGNVTHIHSDIIVNSANPLLTSGSGVNGAIFVRGGPELEKKLESVMKKRSNEALKVGEYVITRGYNCPTKKIIHIISPDCKKEITQEKVAQLRECYKNCLEAFSKEKMMKNLVFVALSTGKFEFPLIQSCHIACSEVRKWLENDKNRKKKDCIVFCVRNEKLHAIYEHIMQLYFKG